MKKVLGIIVGIIVIIIIISSAKSCFSKKRSQEIVDSGAIYNMKQQNKKIEELEEEIKEYKKDAEVKKQEEESLRIEDKNYLNVKFPSDGNFYKEAYDAVTFYSDSTCTKELKNVRFMSPEVDTAQAKNGLNIYCLRMDNGEICYCTESPYLITEGKYQELKMSE